MAGVFGSAGSMKGANDFLALSKRLKAAGEKGLRNELNKTMRDAAKPLIPKIKEAAAAQLPQSGGLAQRIAKKPYRAQTRTGAATAGVRIVGTNVDPRIDQGRVFHPVFGRKPGVVQSVQGGYFSDTMEKETSAIRAEVLRALAEFTNRVTAGL